MIAAGWALIGFAALVVSYFWGWQDGYTVGYGKAADASVDQIDSHRRSN